MQKNQFLAAVAKFNFFNAKKALDSYFTLINKRYAFWWRGPPEGCNTGRWSLLIFPPKGCNTGMVFIDIHGHPELKQVKHSLLYWSTVR